MKNETMRWLKSQLKGKISITKGVIIAFMITGSIFTYAVDEQPEKPTLSPIDITINNYGEQTGLELGDNSRARGIGSVSTGRNGMAIGKNAVAIGENETKESIERKLEENRQKLQEIVDAKKEIVTKAEELRLKQIRERETIEAGIRVEEIQKSKEKARLAWEAKKQELATKTEESKEFFREHQAKIDTLNSKLRGLENLTGADFSSDEGLNHTADLLKAKVEDGTQLNLSHDFYLDYVKTYYKALGDLRNNNTFKDKNYNKSGLYSSDILQPETYGLKHLNLDFNYNTNDIIIPYYGSNPSSGSSSYAASIDSSFSDNSKTSSTYSSYKSSVNSSYNFLGAYELGKFDNNTKNIHRRFLLSNDDRDSVYNVKDKRIKTALNLDTDITSEQEFNDWNSVKDEWKERIKSYNAKLGDELIGKLDTLTGGKSTILYNMVTDMKFELVDLDKQITYYQGQYEKTNNISWLDKKKKALDIRTERVTNNETRLKNKARELGYDLKDGYRLNEVLGHVYWEKWKKENIDDIKSKNTLTTNTLTSELEKALGINKNAVLEKEKELAKLGEQAEQAKKNYEGLNPTESDMILAREYQRVKEEINRLTTDLKNAETRKDNLEKALTLHNLKNVGENQIAFGTDTLAVGSNLIAMGYKAITIGTDSVNIGARGQATGTSITQLGQDLVTNGNKNISIGNTNVINGENNIVFGRNNNIGALGDANKSNGNIVLGSGITVSKDITNSITLGDNSTPISNAISVGSAGNERQIKNVKDATDNQDVVTYKQLKDYVANNSSNVDTSNLANKDLSNVESNTIINKIATGNLDNTNGGLVTDTKIKEKLDLKADKSTVYNKNEIDTKLNDKADSSDLGNYVKVDGTNITSDDIRKNLASKLSENSNISNPKGILVTDSKVKDYLDNNYTNDLISSKLDKGNVTSSTLTITNGENRVLGTDELKVELKNKSITKEHLSETLKNEIDNKANKDASNIETDKYIEKLSKGSDITNPTGKLVKDIDVKKYLDEYNPNGSNLDKFMENIDNKFKVTNAGIAQALAMANTITNKEEKEHTISAGVGYYGNEFATAISYSTHQKNVGLKVSASLDSKLKFGLGAGISYTFGSSKTEIKDPVIKTIAIDDNFQEENEKLKEKIAMLEDKFNSLNSKLDNINKEEKTVLTGYETNKYVLTDIQKEYLNLIVPKLLDKEIEIIGYTDTVGSDKYNLDLGIRRAEFVKNYLESKGITNISVKSAGFNITLNQNNSIDSKAKNRRVEIIVK